MYKKCPCINHYIRFKYLIIVWMSIGFTCWSLAMVLTSFSVVATTLPFGKTTTSYTSLSKKLLSLLRGFVMLAPLFPTLNGTSEVTLNIVHCGVSHPILLPSSAPHVKRNMQAIL
ncbi:unnamed protein product [Ilex paraguariensis]|uniref:Uncharacterized protein n=1 Tax=Ilex paraguariensis TaxID=185542 RepID=A0ABC8R069_9AQUA